MSAGSTLIFVDADCRFEPGCLARLGSLVNQSPHSCFQLHVVGDRSGVIGKAEELRLATLQSYLLQSDGCIRYLNTAGLAIRKEEERQRKVIQPGGAPGRRYASYCHGSE